MTAPKPAWLKPYGSRAEGYRVVRLVKLRLNDSGFILTYALPEGDTLEEQYAGLYPDAPMEIKHILSPMSWLKR